MDEVGKETLELTIKVASGTRSVGEKAGHSQVQLWRDWKQSEPSDVDSLLAKYEKLKAAINSSSKPIDIKPDALKENSGGSELTFLGTQKQKRGKKGDEDDGRDYATDQIGLILPTSLCSGQVADLIATHLNEKLRVEDAGDKGPVTKFVALPHTEGCGCGGGGKSREELFYQTLLGYLTHPIVKGALLLEHGCEVSLLLFIYLFYLFILYIYFFLRLFIFILFF